MRYLPIAGLLFALSALGCRKQQEPVLTSDNLTDTDSNITITTASYRPQDNQLYAVSPETLFTYGGKTVRVKAYSRDVGDTKNSPIFKYGDLINRAIAYKLAHATTEVQVKFVMYKFSPQAYVGFDPAHTSYGYVKGDDFGGDHSEKLMYSIVKAALNQVAIDFVFQSDASATVLTYLNGFMETPCATDPSKKVKDYLRVRKVSWGTEAHQQMHAKYMTVSHYAGDDTDVLHTIFCTTGNVDEHNTTGIPVAKDWVQSGMLVNNHAALMASYNIYFDLIFNHYNSQAAFHTAVRAQHANNALNYDDLHFSSYFTPIPSSPQGNYSYVPETGDGDPANGNAWDINFNPVAKYVTQMASLTGDRYFKANVYHLKTDNFGKKLYNELSAIYNSSSPGLKHFRWVVRTNSYESVFPLSNFNNIGIITQPAATHAKDILFAFSGSSAYYTITGSTNLKLDEHVSKANSSIVVKEFTTVHPVYNAYKDIYNYQY